MKSKSKSFLRFFLSCATGALLVACDPPDKNPDVGDGTLESRSRKIQLEGQPNFRDLGGYRTADGRTVKRRQLFRTGELGQLSDTDVEKLAELDLKVIINFLLPEEIEQHGPDRLPEGVMEVSDPISGERAAQLTMQVQSAISSGEFEKIPPEMNPEFHGLLIEEGKEQYSALLRAAADPEQRPLAFHCSHGVHRTGTATAILLSALGVPWETIREDYVLTNDLREEETKATLAKIRLKVAEDRGVTPDSIDMTNVEAFYILEGSYIDGALKAAEDTYGSMDAYIREGLGLSEAEIEALQSALLE
jgi:protein-tyrosine phosphatase